jgi:lipopolysaccharide/colanic/teichoic acid biosynthesis glycosyltransferase
MFTLRKLFIIYMEKSGAIHMIQVTPTSQVLQPVTAEETDHLNGHNQSDRWGCILKIGLDYLIVLPSLILIAPLLFIIAIFIKMESPGPVFYRHRLIGRNGRYFEAYRFRTMYINHEDIMAANPHLKIALRQQYNLKQDPRLTGTGYLLHRLGIAALPQLFNILKQDISLVGPQAVTYSDLAKYGQQRHTRLTVMPGLIGPRQLNGRANSSFEEQIELDMAYIRTWSPGTDLKLILQTIPALFKHNP